MPKTRDDFSSALRDMFNNAEETGEKEIEITASKLHSEVGDYPDGKLHRMPVCCGVMKKEMKAGDRIVDQPRGGIGPRLTIRYKLPRG